MSNWLKVLPEKELKNSCKVVIKGRSVAVFRLDEKVFALDDNCSHETASLSEGVIAEGEICCPKHGSRFDIRTGRALSLPAFKPVKSYPVKIQGGWIFISL